MIRRLFFVNPRPSTALQDRSDPALRTAAKLGTRRIRHAGMGGLVQQPAPARTDRRNSSRRGRSTLLCPSRERRHGSVDSIQSASGKTRRGSGIFVVPVTHVTAVIFHRSSPNSSSVGTLSIGRQLVQPVGRIEIHQIRLERRAPGRLRLLDVEGALNARIDQAQAVAGERVSCAGRSPAAWI